MSKAMQWVVGIFGILFLASAVTFFILWLKEKKKNSAVNARSITGTSPVTAPISPVMPQSNTVVANATTPVTAEVTARKGVVDVLTQ